MSVVVGIKQEGVIYLGTDSQVSSDMKEIFTNPDNFKISEIHGIPNAYIGVVGRAININIVRIKKDLVIKEELRNNQIDYEYVVNNIVGRIMAYHLEYGVYKEDEIPYTIQSTYLIAHNDRLFLIQNKDGGYVVEIEGHVAIGSGCYEASGSLVETTHLSPVERITKAIKVSKSLDRFVDYPIVIMNTKNKEVITIKENKDYTSEKVGW